MGEMEGEKKGKGEWDKRGGRNPSADGHKGYRDGEWAWIDWFGEECIVRRATGPDAGVKWIGHEDGTMDMKKCCLVLFFFKEGISAGLWDVICKCTGDILKSEDDWMMWWKRMVMKCAWLGYHLNFKDKDVFIANAIWRLNEVASDHHHMEESIWESQDETGVDLDQTDLACGKHNENE